MDGLDNYLDQFAPKTKLDVPNIVDDELGKLGYPDAARLAIVSNVGRENSWNSDTIFAGHDDPANGEKNLGPISWQKERRSDLINYVKANGGDFTPNENNLRLMTRFMDHEMQNSKDARVANWRKIHSRLKDPNITTDEAYPLLQQYIQYQPQFEVNNKDWEAKARARGIGQRGLDNYLKQFTGTAPQPAALDSYLDQFTQPTGKPILVAQPGGQQPAAPADNYGPGASVAEGQLNPGAPTDLTAETDAYRATVHDQMTVAGKQFDEIRATTPQPEPTPEMMAELAAAGKAVADVPVLPDFQGTSSTTAKPLPTKKETAVKGQKMPQNGEVVDTGDTVTAPLPGLPGTVVDDPYGTKPVSPLAAPRGPEGGISNDDAVKVIEPFTRSVSFAGKPENVSRRDWVEQALIPEIAQKAGVDAIDVEKEFHARGDVQEGEYKEGSKAGDIEITQDFLDAVIRRNGNKRQVLNQILATGQDIGDKAKLSHDLGIDTAEIDAALSGENKFYKEALEQGKTNKEIYKGRLDYEKGKLSEDEPGSVADIRAQQFAGWMTKEEADKAIAKEKELYPQLREENTNTPTSLKGVDAARFGLMDNPQYTGADTQVGGKRDDPTYSREAVDKLIQQYGSLANYETEQKALKEKYKYRPLAGGLEFAKRFGNAVPKAIGSLMQTAAVMSEFAAYPTMKLASAVSGMPLTDATSAENNPIYQMGKDFSGYFTDLQNKDFDNIKLISVVPDTLGQITVQMLAGMASGGATLPTAIGAAMGASQQYEDAAKFAKSPEMRLMAAIAGAAAAIPDAIVFNKWFKGLAPGEKTGFIDNLMKGIYTRLGLKYGDKAAEEMTKIAAQTWIQKLEGGAAKIAEGSAFEGVQEVSENKSNDFVANWTYDPSPERTKKLTSWNDEDTMSFIGGLIGGAGGGAVEIATESTENVKRAYDSLPDLLEQNKISQREYEKIEPIILADLERRNVKIDAQPLGKREIKKSLKGQITEQLKPKETPVEALVSASEDASPTPEAQTRPAATESEPAPVVERQRTEMLDPSLPEAMAVLYPEGHALPKVGKGIRRITMPEGVVDLNEKKLGEHGDVDMWVRRLEKGQVYFSQLQPDAVAKPTDKTSAKKADTAAKYSPATVALHEAHPVLKKFGIVARGDTASVKTEGKAGESLAMASRDVEKTPEFKKFIEGSHIQTPVFHGNPQGNVKFADPERGVFFTSNTKVADDYADPISWSRRGDKPTVVPAYLSIKNPLIIDANGKRHDNIPVPWQEWKPKTFGNLPKGTVSVEDAYKYAMENGHDGLIVNNVVDTADITAKAKGNVYAVKSPTQIKSAIDNSILAKARTKESQDKLSALVDAPLSAEHIETVAKPKLTKYGVEVDEQTIEIVRRATDAAGLGNLQVDGQFHEPKAVKSVTGHLRNVAKALREAGETKAARKIENLVYAMQTDADQNQGAASVYIYDDAGKHEYGHRLSYLGVPESANKDLAVRYGDLTKIAKSPSFQTAANNWQAKEGRSTPIDQMTPKQKAHAAEEIVQYIASGDTLGLTVDEAAALFVDLMRQYAKARISENPRLDMDTALSHFKGHFSDELINEATNEKTDTAGKESRGSGTSDAESGQQPDRTDTGGGAAPKESAKNFTPGGEEKLSKTPSTLRSNNIPVEDRTYTSVTNQEQQEFADTQLNKGLDRATDWFNEQISDKNPNSGATTVVGLNLMNELGNQGRISEMNKVADDLVPFITEAAQTVQAVATVSAFNPENAGAYAAKTAKQHGNKLTDAQFKKAKNLAVGLNETAQADAFADATIKEKSEQAVDLALEMGAAKDASATERLDIDLEGANKEIAKLRQKIGDLQNKKKPTKKTEIAKIEAREQDILEAIKAKYTKDDVLRMASVQGNPAFKKWFGDSKVVDDSGKPLVVYSGHANIELYGDRYDPKKGTAGGFYASESPEVTSNYATGKLGNMEEFSEGSQYRFKQKNGKFGQKIWQIQFDDKQQAIAREYIKDLGYDIEQYWKDNRQYDADARHALARGGLRDAQSVFTFLDSMGENIWYADHESTAPYFEKQKKGAFEEILDAAGIEWQSFERSQPGNLPLYLSIKNPLDAAKPFPPDLLKALKQKASRVRDPDYASGQQWSKEYSMREWVERIESGDEYWTTQIPAKAIDIIKSFGYDGVKELGNKGETDRAKRQINWIAFEPGQIKSATGNRGAFDPNDPSILRMASKQEIETDPDLVDWATLTLSRHLPKGDMTVGEFYNELNKLTSGQLSPEQIADIHAEAIGQLKTVRNVSPEKKAAQRTRGEHYKTSEQHLNRFDAEIKRLLDEQAARLRTQAKDDPKTAKEAEKARLEKNRKIVQNTIAQKQSDIAEFKDVQKDEARIGQKAVNKILADDQRQINAQDKLVTHIIEQGITGNYSDEAIFFALARKAKPKVEDAMAELKKEYGDVSKNRQREIMSEADALYIKAKDAARDSYAQAKNEYRLNEQDLKNIREEKRINLRDARQIQKDATRFYSGLTQSKGRVIADTAVSMRRANLLTGVKTHFRNIAGNTMFAGSEEISRVPATIADFGASLFTGNRTVQGISPSAIIKSFDNIIRQDETLKNLDKESGINAAKQILKYGDTMDNLEKQQHSQSILSTKFEGKLPKAIDWYIDKVFATLGAEDALFKTYAFRRALEEEAFTQALSEYKQDRSIDRAARQKQLIQNPTFAMQQIASDYADFATFQNDNWLSAQFTKFKKLHPAIKTVSEIVVPYDRTPTNIVLRVLEHAPVIGTGMAINKAFDIKSEPSKEFRNKYTEAVKKDMPDFEDMPETMRRDVVEKELNKIWSRQKQREFAQTFGRSSWGTALFAGGFFLAAANLLTGSMSPDDDDKAETNEFFKRRATGIENKSLRIPGVGRFVLTDDPAMKVMAAGATFYEQMTMSKGSGVKAAWDGVSETTHDILTEQPLLNNMGQLYNVVKKGKAGEYAGSTISGFVPASAMVGDISEITDEASRTGSGYDPANKKERSNMAGEMNFQVRGFRNSLLKKVPYFRFYADESKDAFPKGTPLRRAVRAIDIFNTRPPTPYQSPGRH